MVYSEIGHRYKYTPQIHTHTLSAHTCTPKLTGEFYETYSVNIYIKYIFLISIIKHSTDTCVGNVALKKPKERK